MVLPTRTLALFLMFWGTPRVLWCLPSVRSQRQCTHSLARTVCVSLLVTGILVGVSGLLVAWICVSLVTGDDQMTF